MILLPPRMRRFAGLAILALALSPPPGRTSTPPARTTEPPPPASSPASKAASPAPAPLDRTADAATHIVHASLYMSEGKFAEAEREYRAADAVQPNEYPILDGLSIVLTKMGRTEEALAVLQRAIKSSNHFNDRAYLLAARLFARGGRNKEGEKLLIEWAGPRPIVPNFHAAIGILRMGGGDPEGAERELRAALDGDPANEAALSAVFKLYGGVRRYDEAERLIDKGLAAKPDSVAVLMLSGSCYLRQAKHAQAKAAFEKLLKIEPKNADAWVNLGWAVHEMGDTEGGMRDFRHAIELSPKGVEGPVNLALAIERSAQTSPAEEKARKLREARDVLLAARKRGVEETDLLNALAVAHHLNGETDEAIAVAKASIAIDPHQKMIKQLLDSLQAEKRQGTPAPRVPATSAPAAEAEPGGAGARTAP